MIRPARHDDARQIGELHARVWGTHGRDPDAEADLFAAHFRHVYLENPWYDEECGPLVHEEADGRITGVLGIVRRPVRLGDRRLWMAVSSELACDPSSRSQLAAVQMVKRFLHGPQDLSLADNANGKARKLWQGLGGTTSRPHSLHWWRPLSPFRFVCSLLKRRPGLNLVARLAAPFARAADAVATRLPFHPLRMLPPSGSLVPLTPEIVHEHADRCLPAGALRSEGTLQVTAWIWSRLDDMFDRRRLHRWAVLSNSGDVLGWFVYAMTEGRADVWQVAARHDAVATVLNQLWWQAGGAGAHVATGRVDPHHTAELAEAGSLFTARGPFVLTHAGDPAIRAAVNSGDACLSHLDGERLLSCHYDDDLIPLVKYVQTPPCPPLHHSDSPKPDVIRSPLMLHSQT